MQEAFVPIKAEHMMQQAPAQHSLLAAFAFFSPLQLTSHVVHPVTLPACACASGYSPYTPHKCLTHQFPGTVCVWPGRLWSTPEVVQAAHLLVSTLVFFYVLVAMDHWRSAADQCACKDVFFLLSYACAVEVKQCCEHEESASIGRKAYDRAALTDALVPACRGSADEAARLRAALRAWVRLGELVAFDGTVGNITRLQTYWCMSWHISTFAATTTDLSTLALIIRPVSNAKAAALWDQARKREFLRAHEKIVLNNMSVDDAADWLTKWRRWHETERKGRCSACEKRTPLGVLAAILIRERLRKHAASLFVRTVVSEESCASECESDGYVYDAEKDFKEEQERKETVEAGKSIGGRTAELAILLERIWDTGFCTHEDVLPVRRTGNGRSPDVDADCEDAQDLASQDEAEIRALLSATIIYRRIFPSSIPACATALPFILSPPPSPSRRNAALHMALRTALGSPAFEFSSDGRLDDEELGLALEDARDRVVDMLVDFERACRRGGRF
ncbi:hypothetical protein A0H81_02609 [Grifola frondosa]|uniref:Uncharacterized protein n=1 Tax=Grifola frondosa TaxID=5627 RepID=A0A1C7MMU4_GRIFR|nr:hypothetical protein A0H81_02609 [Grifola frondosa]